MRTTKPIPAPALPQIEVFKPSCPNPRDPILTQLVAALEECVAYMDSPVRHSPLVNACCPFRPTNHDAPTMPAALRSRRA